MSTPQPSWRDDYDALDKDPTSFEAVISYGSKPLEALGKLASRMIATQGDFNQGITDATGALKRVEKQLRKIKPEDPFSPQHLKLQDDFNAMAAAAQKIAQSKADAGAIAAERRQLSQDIRDALAQAKTALGDYTNKHIPNAADPDEEALLRRRREDFTDRLTVLEGARAASVIAGQQVVMMMQTMDDMEAKLTPILDEVKTMVLGELLDREEKEAAVRAVQAIENISQAFRDGTEAAVTVKKPLQYKPKP